jgi:quinol-cytochrome oxidoreductase complex cytochrome b subunit
MDASSRGPEFPDGQRAPEPDARRSLLDALLDFEVPSGARSWFAHLGGLAAMLLALQACTGVLLLIHYRGGDGACASVALISSQVPYGWLIRGLHQASSHLLVGLLFAHAVVAWALRAFHAPRQRTWMSGCLLLGVVMAFAWTGTVLPGDQRALFTARVGLHGARSLPLVGAHAAGMLGGGADAGNETLHRMLALHVGLLPLVLVAIGAVHLMLVRVHGLSRPRDPHAHAIAWYPDFVWREAMLCISVVVAMCALCAWWPPLPPRVAHPLEPTPAGTRPLWLFLPLYQMLKLLPPTLLRIRGEHAAWLACGAAALALFFLPLWGAGRRAFVRRISDGLVVAVALAWVALGIWAWASG